MNSIKKTLYFTTIFVFFVNNLFAQKEANVWYLNNQYGVEFSTLYGKERFDSKMNISTTRQSATICDSIGNLLFHTDGISIWNNQHKVIAHDLKGGNTVAIVPYPLNKDIYYIFYTGQLPYPESYPLDTKKAKEIQKKEAEEKKKNKEITLYYSLLDIKSQKFVEKDVMLAKNILFDFCIARHKQGFSYWIVTHEVNSNKFLSFLLDRKGIGKIPSESSIGKIYSIDEPLIKPNFTIQKELELSYFMKVSIQGDKIVLDKIGVDDGFEVFDFDNVSGKITKNYVISYMNNTYYTLDSEFSPNGHYIYILLRYKEKQPEIVENTIFQYNLNDKYEKFIEKTVENIWLVSESISRHDMHLQIGVNGRIYISVLDVANYVLSKPNKKIFNIHKYKETWGNKLGYVNAFNIFKFGGKMPKVAHLLPLSLVNKDEEIELNKPFIREILFETNQAILKPEYETELQDIVNFMLQNPKTSIEIMGHTDNEGEETKNKKLSEDRAKALANYLIKNKIAPDRIKAIGYGSSKPIAENTSSENKAKNRRIEFLITEKK